MQSFPNIAMAAENRKQAAEFLGKPKLRGMQRLNGTGKWYVIIEDANAPLILMGMRNVAAQSPGGLFKGFGSNFDNVGTAVKDKSFIEMRVTLPGDQNYQKTGEFLISVRIVTGSIPGISQAGIEITQA